MQKKDIYNHIKNFERWTSQITPKYIEEGLTKENSKLYTEYFLDLGKRKSIGYVNRNRSKMKSIFIGLQNKGIKDVTKVKIEQIEEYFFEWCKDHSPDYVQRWNAFWSWWRTKKRKQGEIVKDITLKLSDFRKGNGKESFFVWLTKEEFDQLRSYFDKKKQALLLFCFDSLIRYPTELSSLKVENIFEKNGEVWVNIPQEISKTRGRKFNLVYSGGVVLGHIKENELKPEDYLFSFSPVMLNKELQKIAKQLWDNKKSEGGEFYKNISGYDLRHSGAIHFRQLFQKTGQSLDLLRERGGWSDFNMINYYTKRLGLDGHIQKERLLLEEDKSNLEKENEKQKNLLNGLSKDFTKTLQIIIQGDKARTLSERKEVLTGLKKVFENIKQRNEEIGQK